MKRPHFALPEIYGEPLSFYEILTKQCQLLNEETLDRKNADDELQHNINTEKSAREQADTTLQNAINTEKSAREQSDTNLQNAINTEKSARERADTTLQQNINTEVSAREQADTTLQQNINTEVSAREQADKELRELIRASSGGVIGVTEAQLNEEITARQNADNILQANIDNEKQSREQADTDLQTNIDNEALEREQADTTLQNAINTEKSSRERADTTLQQNINAETKRATDKETELKNDIDATKASVLNEIKAWVNETQHPIGSIYITTKKVNPSNIFGGTWEQLKDHFLLACGDKYNPGTTGGEAEHTLSIDEMPSHSHDTVNSYIIANDGDERPITFKNGTDARVSQNTRATVNVGGNLPHNNMPPYITVYVWKRIR